jgi:hypothetical protein
VPIGIGFDVSTQPPRGPRGATGATGRAATALGLGTSFDSSIFSIGGSQRGKPGHDGKNGRSFLSFAEPLFMPRPVKSVQKTKTIFTEPPVLTVAQRGKEGPRGPRGASKPLFINDESFSFVRRVDQKNFWHFLSKQESFFLIRQKKVVPQPVLLSHYDQHVQVRHTRHNHYQTSVSSNFNQWLVKTVQRRTTQALSSNTNQTFVRQKQVHVQKCTLQVSKHEAFLSKRFTTQKKTQLLQTFASTTSLRQTSVHKTVNMYQGPISYHFITNNNRLERLMQRYGNTNGLIFTGDSSLTLTGDSGVTIA